MHDGDNPRHEGWREVAKRIQVENDTDKVGELVQELIEKYDEQKLRPCRSSRHAR
jgi:molybdopterin converting factor small subunit